MAVDGPTNDQLYKTKGSDHRREGYNCRQLLLIAVGESSNNIKSNTALPKRSYYYRSSRRELHRTLPHADTINEGRAWNDREQVLWAFVSLVFTL